MKGSTSTARNGPTDRTRFHLSGRSIALDGRIHAARGDLADISLAGTLFSAHYARAVELTCITAGAVVHG
ncbi:MAG: glycoside hydrolase, partial [Sphingobium sp.]